MRALKRERGDRQWLVLYVIVCIEVGVFLTLVPWSGIWERNYFLGLYPALRPILLAPAVRGAVAGLGAANIFMGLKEVLNLRRASITEKDSRAAVGDPGGASGADDEIGRESGREAIAPAEERH
jgi:hypothetical protein